MNRFFMNGFFEIKLGHLGLKKVGIDRKLMGQLIVILELNILIEYFY